MIDPNRGASEEVLNRLRDESYERMRIELFNSIKQLLSDHDMTWDDLAEKLQWYNPPWDGVCLRRKVGKGILSMEELNDITHCFSAEAYIIFRPRFPFTGT